MHKDDIRNENECDCDEDNKCGCSYPNNVNKFACGCDEHDSDCECLKTDNKTQHHIIEESICICDTNADCSCNKIG